MKEEPYPYNLPPWRRSYEATSPNGQWCATLKVANEIFMSGPTKGLLSVEPLFDIPDCSPSFIWSHDSRYLAVPQWKYWFRRRERLLIINTHQKAVFASRSVFRLLILDSFRDGIIVGTDSPLRKPRRITLVVDEEVKKFKRIEGGGAYR